MTKKPDPPAELIAFIRTHVALVLHEFQSAAIAMEVIGLHRNANAAKGFVTRFHRELDRIRKAAQEKWGREPIGNAFKHLQLEFGVGGIYRDFEQIRDFKLA